MNPVIMARSLLAGLLLCGGVAVACGVAVAGGIGQMPSLAAVGAVEPGQWQIKEEGSSAAPRSLCVGDPASLLQIEHGQARCTHLVLSDQARAGTISYTCPGSGNGRTTLKLLSSSDFRLETQGVYQGAPFDKAYQAHRLGACAAPAH